MTPDVSGRDEWQQRRDRLQRPGRDPGYLVVVYYYIRNFGAVCNITVSVSPKSLYSYPYFSASPLIFDLVSSSVLSSGIDRGYSDPLLSSHGFSDL